MDTPVSTTPFWQTTLSPSPSRPPLLEGAETDVAIIGGGFTGLSTAMHLRRLSPGTRVRVLEAEQVGFGASGRNAGFGMTLFGLNLATTRLRFGDAKARDAHRYMESAVDSLWSLIQEERIDCDAERSGFLRIGTTPAYAKRVRKDVELAQKLGLGGIEWLDAEALRKRVTIPGALGAWWEPRCVLLNPARFAHGLARLAEREGATIHERTRVTRLTREQGSYTLTTEGGARLRAHRIVLATNAFTNDFPVLRSRQTPVYTRVAVTEPFGDRLRELGWSGREGLEDSRNLIHYFRLTRDQRLLLGGGDVHLPFGARTDSAHDVSGSAIEAIRRAIAGLFPALKDVPIAHAWGGPVSVTLDMAPALGRLGGDPGIVYSAGCTGHGVSMSQQNGLTLAELLLERETERTQAFFVNRAVLPWPPEPLRFALGQGIRAVLKAEDAWMD